MPRLTTNLRVFVSSPGDVKKERDLFQQIIESVNKVLSDSDIRFELVMWETDAYPSVGIGDAQQVINEQIGTDDYDIFVGIMWTRFGTPTSRAGSGTEEEFNLALEKQTSTPSRSRILFYFKDSSPKLLANIDLVQFEKVKAFKEKLQSIGLVWEYSNHKKFSEYVKTHLLRHARDFRKSWGFDRDQDSQNLPVQDTDFGEIPDPLYQDYTRDQADDEIKVFSIFKTYERLNLEEAFEWRKHFTIQELNIEGVPNESLLFKLRSELSYSKVFDVSIEEAIDGDTWLEHLDYNIGLLKKPFLSITFHVDGIGAYPWHESQPIVVNLETGQRLKAADFLKAEALSRLASIINEMVQYDLRRVDLVEGTYEEIQLEPVSVLSDDEEEREWSVSERYSDNKFTTESLDNFSIDEYGITFEHDFGFPHVIKALEPEGKYYFEYSALTQLMRDDHPLTIFFRQNLGL